MRARTTLRSVTSPRVSDADRAYFRRLGEENERLREIDPAGSLEEVLRRLETMRRLLGSLAEPALPRDEALADQQAAALAQRWRRRRAGAA
jgi:hypothetical protein